METTKRKFIMSWVSYIVICGFLAIVNYATSDHYPWVLWVMAGWGLGQLIHTVDYMLARRKRRSSRGEAASGALNRPRYKIQMPT